MPTPKAPFNVRSDVRPVVTMSQKNWDEIMYLVRKAPKEVLWYSLIDVDRSPANAPPGFVVYHVSEIFIPKQRCGNKEVETPDGQSLNDLWQDAAGGDQKKAVDLVNRGGCWAHSHVEMPVTPSDQDKKQWAEIHEGVSKKNNKTVQIMMIVNRNEEYTLVLWDPIVGLEWENPPFVIDSPWDMSWIDTAIKTKLSIMKGDSSSLVTPSTATGLSNLPVTSGGHSSSGGNSEPVGFVFTTLERPARA
jgi:hypothetical protein